MGQENFSNTKVAVGLSGPEMLHAGFGQKLSKSGHIGLFGGIGPTMDGVWTSFNLEHRLYVGTKKWFVRQGYSYFPKGPDHAFTLTIGKDLKSKKANGGWTIDGGLFYLLYHSDDLAIGPVLPAIRLQYYVFFKK
jgi:hypothetical protein